MAGLWIVGQVKLNCEKLAASNIARQDFPLYMPLVAEVIDNPRAIRAKLMIGKPLFRGYVFVDIENRRWQPLLSTQGLWGLVGVGPNRDRPSSLPDGTVEMLRAREDDEGMVKLPKRSRLKAGQTVRISNGALKDRLGIVEGMDNKERVKILIDFLERKTSVLIAKELVEAV